MIADSSSDWSPTTHRDAFSDVDELCGAVSPEVGRIAPAIKIWDNKAPFRLGPLDDPTLLGGLDRENFEDFLGETHEDFNMRLNRQSKRIDELSLIIRVVEGADPLRAIPLPTPSMSLLNSVQLAGVDSTLATIDQFDDVLSVISGDLHYLNRITDNATSRADLYVLNPRLISKEISGKTHMVTQRAEIGQGISKSMKQLEYGLAYMHGRGKLVVMDGTLFGQDKVLAETLVSEGIVFCSVVKNPISKIIQSWYPEVFEEYGYENSAMDAVAFNDLLQPGTRSAFVYAEMISWTSKVFTYYKPPIAGATALRIEVPSDYAYLLDRIVNVVHCACTANSDPMNATVLPVVHAEYVAKTMLPDPYKIAEHLRSALSAHAQETSLLGSFNERRGFPLAN